MGATTASASAAGSRGPVRAGKVDGPREETSLLAFASILLAQRRVIVLSALAGTAVAGIMAAASANLYVSRASFVVRGTSVPIELPGGSATLRALAASSELSQSVNFYSDLVKARSIAHPVAAKTYTMSNGERKTLAQVYGIDEKDQRVANLRAGDRLIEDVASSIYSRSGVIGLTVRSTDPLVAQQLATEILAQVDAYGGNRRQTQSAEERRFVEQILLEARARLDRAEEDVAAFLRNNREYRNSPSLRLAFDRLTRNVMNQQQVYMTLVTGYEQAKIEEVRDPAALNIVEAPDLPGEPERRDAFRRTLLGLAAGLMVGIIVALIRQRAAESRALGTAGYIRYTDALKG